MNLKFKTTQMTKTCLNTKFNSVIVALFVIVIILDIGITPIELSKFPDHEAALNAGQILFGNSDPNRVSLSAYKKPDFKLYKTT